MVEKHSDEPVQIGAVLQDLDAVLAADEDPARHREVIRTDVLDEIAVLEQERDNILANIRGGQNDPSLRGQLEHVKQALLEAQADEVDTRHTTDGIQPGE